MTSIGGKMDNRVNDGRGPYIFRLNGQTHHRIGTLHLIMVRTPSLHSYISMILKMKSNTEWMPLVVVLLIKTLIHLLLTHWSKCLMSQTIW